MIYVMLFLGILMIVAAVYALYSRNIVSAIIASGAVSLIASLAYLMYGAPDVAMTEAAIGSGLTTLVFLIAWSRMKNAAGGEVESD